MSCCYEVVVFGPSRYFLIIEKKHDFDFAHIWTKAFYEYLFNERLFVFSMEGGELFSRIQARGDQAFTEKGEYR